MPSFNSEERFRMQERCVNRMKSASLFASSEMELMVVVNVWGRFGNGAVRRLGGGSANLPPPPSASKSKI